MRNLMLCVAAVAGLSVACSASPTYEVLISVPSGMIGVDPGMGAHDRLILHWSCDRGADPGTRYRGGPQAGLWTDVEGAENVSTLRATVTCPADAMLTAQVDGSLVSFPSHPTTLRCQVFDSDGRMVADETATRGRGVVDPVCRAIVKS
jgi:hypothetical protein